MNPGRKLLWTESIKVRWGDMDALGHVNNTVYFRYMEQARVSWFEALGVPVLENGCGPVIVKAVCEFLKPITYPATVAIPVYLEKTGRSSFVVAHDIHLDGDPAAVFARGEVVVVWIDHAQEKSRPLPQHILRALA
ncbi:MAG: thioesterase family protein [Burkholderiales bacterium]|nr:thioesterase family protein [Burkholderiales bacterium]